VLQYKQAYNQGLLITVHTLIEHIEVMEGEEGNIAINCNDGYSVK